MSEGDTLWDWLKTWGLVDVLSRVAHSPTRYSASGEAYQLDHIVVSAEMTRSSTPSACTPFLCYSCVVPFIDLHSDHEPVSCTLSFSTWCTHVEQPRPRGVPCTKWRPHDNEIWRQTIREWG